MAELTGVEHAEQEGMLKQQAPIYGYYRQPNGWITVSPMTQLEELKYRQEGWEPLSQYGRLEMTSEYTADHPLEVLFMGGGVKELCRDQIIQSGLHLNPPLVPTCRQPISQFHKRHNGTCWVDAKPVSFPQLEEVPAGLPCRFCTRELPTEDAREQHEGVAHKEEKGDIRTGQTLAEHLVKGLKGGDAIQRVPQVLPGDFPYRCGFCSAGSTSPVKLAQHVKENHKENVNGTEATEGSGEAEA